MNKLSSRELVELVNTVYAGVTQVEGKTLKVDISTYVVGVGNLDNYGKITDIAINTSHDLTDPNNVLVDILRNGETVVQTVKFNSGETFEITGVFNTSENCVETLCKRTVKKWAAIPNRITEVNKYVNVTVAA